MTTTAKFDLYDLCNCPPTIPCEYGPHGPCLNVTVGQACRVSGETLAPADGPYNGTLSYSAHAGVARGHANGGDVFTLFAGFVDSGAWRDRDGRNVRSVGIRQGGMDAEALRMAATTGMLPTFGGFIRSVF